MGVLKQMFLEEAGVFDCDNDYPPKCCECGRFLSPESGEIICWECLAIKMETEEICPG